ncbi:hypothetical protein D9615_001611 [Tricholomella constricta]|uniref:Restriction of telomere capping protein 4 n=1 Tax=Tricholomella constricta TaxID=117010 RepID=A0A8H5MAT0_9AGAR|nr:hypothetical protein D9615_001611 [Tricholomella constricta]
MVRDAALNARANNCPRDPCKAHKVLAISDTAVLIPRQPALQARDDSRSSTPESQSSNSPASSTPEPSSPTPLSTLQLPPPSQPHPSQSSQHTATQHRRRQLAQPIGPNWLEEKTAADVDKASMESLKQMDEISKKTCTFVIYRKSGAPPIELRREIKTYPQLEIGTTLADLMAEFELTERSLFDYWDAGNWMVINANTPVIVEKGRRILLRFRPSFEEELSLDDCPGITDELGQQPRASGTKRSSNIQLVSPLKKVTKTSETRVSHSTPSSLSSLAIDLTASSPPPHNVSKVEPPDQDTVLNLGSELKVVNGIAIVKTLQDLPIASWETGWKQIKHLIDQDPRKVTESESFPKVFGFSYSKSSVCKYKSVFKKAPQGLRHHFIAMGNVKAATWREFTNAVRSWTPTGAHHTLATSAIDLTMNSDHDDEYPNAPTPFPPAGHAKSPPSTTLGSIIITNAPVPTAAAPLSSLTAPAIPRVIAPIPRDFPILSPILHSSSLQPAPVNTTGISSALANILCDYGSDDDNDDIDHALLCPFCDEPLPDNPTSGLLRQRASLEKKSRLDPMPNNRLHRTTETFTTFLPHARRAGWPDAPSFASLFDRVVAHHPALVKVLTDTRNVFFADAKSFYGRTGAARMQGASSQYSSARFAQFGAGYYGEQGYQIIFIALQHLFSFSIDATHIHPLSQDTFLREVLVPKAAVLIIQDDLHLSRSRAIETLRTSRTFGNVMHPIDEACPIVDEATRRGMNISRSLQVLFHSWQASNTLLDFETWAKEQHNKEEERRVKREEIDFDIEAVLSNESQDPELLHCSNMLLLNRSRRTTCTYNSTTIKTDRIHSNPYAVLTVLNMHIHHEHPSIEAIANYALQKTAATNPAFHGTSCWMKSPPSSTLYPQLTRPAPAPKKNQSAALPSAPATAPTSTPPPPPTAEVISFVLGSIIKFLPLLFPYLLPLDPPPCQSGARSTNPIQSTMNPRVRCLSGVVSFDGSPSDVVAPSIGCVAAPPPETAVASDEDEDENEDEDDSNGEADRDARRGQRSVWRCRKGSTTPRSPNLTKTPACYLILPPSSSLLFSSISALTLSLAISLSCLSSIQGARAPPGCARRSFRM